MNGGPAPEPRHPTLSAALEAASASGLGVCFVDLRERESWVSWEEVRRRARRAAADLDRLGIRPGDRVALVLRTEPDFLHAFFGVLAAGAVPVPLYPPVRLGRLDEYTASTARMLEVSKARALVAGRGIRGLMGTILERARPDLGCLAAEELGRGNAELERESHPADLALVQFSSGSTVEPKPVALTQANIAHQCATLIALVRPTSRDCLVSWLPLYHDMGLIGSLLGTMSYPGPLVLIPPEHFLARPALWLRAISRHRGTVSAAPSFAYGYAAQRVSEGDLAGHDLSAWRIALDGAEPVSAEAGRRFSRRFAPFGFRAEALTPCYGLSEASLAVTCAPPGRPLRTRGVDPAGLAVGRPVATGDHELVSLGPPVPGTEVVIRDEQGRPLPEGRLGRIAVRGPSVMSGYLGDPAASERSLAGGWLDTGDLGFAWDGELFVCGRSRDLVIVRGANHAPEAFEACLEGVPGLRAGCAVALGFVPPGADGEELLLLAERSRDAGRDADIEERIRAAVLERTGVRPHTVRVLEPGTLPRTSSGKMRRSEALRQFLGGTLRPPRKVTVIRMALAFARSSLARLRASGKRRAPIR